MPLLEQRQLSSILEPQDGGDLLLRPLVRAAQGEGRPVLRGELVVVHRIPPMWNLLKDQCRSTRFRDNERARVAEARDSLTAAGWGNEFRSSRFPRGEMPPRLIPRCETTNTPTPTSSCASS